MKVPVFNYSIKNAAEGEIDIFIDGAIVDASTQQFLKDFFGDDTTTSFKSFREQLSTVEAKTYNVYINSPGGIVTDAMAIHDLLIEMQSQGKTVNTIGRGIIASAATYILMAGNNSRMSKNSWFMIHNVGGGVMGDVNAIESYANTLRKFNNRTRDFYSEATGLRKEDITKMMNAETWMTADEAKEKGFIKVVDGEAKFTNVISNESWLYSNLSVLNAYNASVSAPTTDTNSSNQNFESMKKFFQDLGNQIMNAIKEIKAPASTGNEDTHSVLMQSIGEAVNNSFSAAAEQMESAINDLINSKDGGVMKSEDVKNVVEETLKPFAEQMEALELENEELKKDIANLKAGKNTTKEQKDAEPITMKGSWGE